MYNNETLIKDIFKEEILEIKHYIYSNMQSTGIRKKKNAIKAWDIFDNMINKKISDTDSLCRFIHILDMADKAGLVDFQIDNKKMKRLANDGFKINK